MGGIKKALLATCSRNG